MLGKKTNDFPTAYVRITSQHVASLPSLQIALAVGSGSGQVVGSNSDVGNGADGRVGAEVAFGGVGDEVR